MAWAEPLQLPVSDARAALVLVADASVRRQPPFALFAAAHRLTPAETRICARLLDGLSLAEVSAALEVSQSTLRWHMRDILLKTESRGQAELLLKMARFGVPARRE